MNRINWILILLLCFNLAKAEQATPDSNNKLSPEQITAAETEYMVWFNQLNEHWLKSDDSYEETMGLAAMVNGGKADKAQYSSELKQAHATILNNIIKQDQLSSMTLPLLVQLCFDEVLVEYCNQSTLLDKQLQQNPENLNSYLHP